MSNNNLSVLPFYKSTDEQDFRKSYSYGEVYPLYAQAGILLPFQIIRDHKTDSTLNVMLYQLVGEIGESVINLTQAMTEGGLQIVNFPLNGYDVILYPAIFPISQITMLSGRYFLAISDDADTWYSEVFTIVQDMTPYVKIEWYNEENLYFDNGCIVFNEPRFHNFLYFATEIGKPEYTFEEEGEQRDGFFFPEKQLSEKTYKCTILAPEYLCDCMRLIRMADHVRVTDNYGRIYDCDTFLITPEWQEQGNLASVEIEFQTDTVVKKIGRGYAANNIGDFNDDYSDDFLNS